MASESPRTPKPSRKDRLRPLELVGFSAVLAVFAGLVIMLVMRTPDRLVDFKMAGIVTGLVFIVSLLTVALIGLGGTPSDEDLAARNDLQTPEKDSWH